MIDTHNHHRRPARRRLRAVGADCWVGMGAIILPGVTIGEGCVVGAGSVVAKDLPDLTVAVGNPATVIRDRRGAAA